MPYSSACCLQGELLLRSEELRDTLWALCDQKMDEFEGEKVKVAADSFVHDQATLLGQYYSGLVQVELDK